MDNKADEQFLVMKSTIESNSQNTDEKLTNITEDIALITLTITSMMDQTKNSKYFPYQKDTSNPPDPTTVVLYDRRDTPLNGGHSTKIGGM